MDKSKFLTLVSQDGIKTNVDIDLFNETYENEHVSEFIYEMIDTFINDQDEPENEFNLMMVKDKYVKLFGRQTYPGSNHWNYYTTTDTHLKIQIPVFNHDPANNPKDDCLDDRGCLEFNTGDYAWANNIRYKVTMHRYRTLRYIP